MDPKCAAAEKAVELIQTGMTVGLGSGSTATWAIKRLGERVNEGLQIRAVASSLKSEMLAKQLAIPLIDHSDVTAIDIAVDGADEVDTKGNLIKGGGGSLLREKLIAYASQRFHVIVDESKLVQGLGKFPLAVEIVPFATGLTLKHLEALACKPVIRQTDGGPFISDNGNLVADCKFAGIDDPAWLDVKLKMIPGVVETGLFSYKIVTSVFIGYATGEVKEMRIAASSD